MESVLMSMLLDRSGPAAVAVVRWLVTGEHVGGAGLTVDRGWPLPAMPDPWV